MRINEIKPTEFMDITMTLMSLMAYDQIVNETTPVEEVTNLLIEESTINKIISKRIDIFNLEERVNKFDVIFTASVLGIDNPGKAVILLIEFLDYFDAKKKKATFKDFLEYRNNLVYSNDEYGKIIDDIKDNKMINGYIY